MVVQPAMPEQSATPPLADVLPAMIIRGAPDGSIRYFNQRWYDYTGADPERPPGEQIRGALHPDEVDDVIRRWNEAVAAGQEYSIEFRLRRADGVFRWHLARVVPVADARGEIVSWVSASTDIEDRKCSEERAKFLAEAGRVLASSLDYEATLRRVTSLAVPAVADLCSIDVLEADGSLRRVALTCADPAQQARLDAMPPAFSPDPEGNHPARRVLRSGKAEQVFDVQDSHLVDTARDEHHLQLLRGLGVRAAVMAPLIAHGRKFGTVLFATMSSERSFGPDDLALAEDLSAHAALAIDNARIYNDARLLAEDLERANAAKDEFLGLVSHELRTPLTTIQGNATILARDPARTATPAGRDALADIVNDSQRLERIIENLLLVARAEAGQEAEREPLLVVRLVRKVMADHQRRHPGRRFEIVEREQPRLVNVPPVYLQQIIENLVTNAEKYSPPNEPITVEIERTDEEVRVRVLDCGDGIRPEDIEHIFDPFFRSSSVRGRAAGLGIGLSVCKRLVEALGGRIWVRPREGGGSEFGFALPLLEEDVEEEQAAVAQ